MAGKRRVSRSDALSAFAVTSRARDQASFLVTLMIQRMTHPGSHVAAFKRQAGIVTCYRLALARVQRPGNPAHLRVMTPAVGIGLKLPLQIAPIQSCQSRRTRSIASPVEPVAGEARVARTPQSGGMTGEGIEGVKTGMGRTVPAISAFLVRGRR